MICIEHTFPTVILKKLKIQLYVCDCRKLCSVVNNLFFTDIFFLFVFKLVSFIMRLRNKEQNSAYEKPTSQVRKISWFLMLVFCLH